MAEIKQYVDMDGLRKLLLLIKDTYVCQNGLTSEIRKQIQDMVSGIGTSTIVREVISDKTDPYEIASDFGYTSWNNGDFLIAKNSAGNNSVFYWYNSSWICMSKAPVDDLDMDAVEEYLKENTLTADAIVKLIDEKIQNIEVDGAPVNIGIATEEKAGLVKPSDEISVSAISGLMAIKAVPVGKITGLDEKIRSLAYGKSEVYTKEEVNHLLLVKTSAEEMASTTVTQPDDLNKPENISLPVGSIANVTNEDGSTDSYILTEMADGSKKWVLIEHEASITEIAEKIAELEEKTDSSGAWDRF